MDREVLERLTTPRGELQLQRRGADYEVISNGCFLMATYNGGSEADMIRLSRQFVPDPRRILVGGLGAGYTLRAALDVPGVELVTVVEIEPAVVKWNYSHLAPFNGSALADPRTDLFIGDLADFLSGTPRPYDLVALDTDNGPDWTVFDHNQALWSGRGLDVLAPWVAPGGAAAFWSAHRSDPFEERLRHRFRRVEVHEVPAAVTGVPDVIYLAGGK